MRKFSDYRQIHLHLEHALRDTSHRINGWPLTIIHADVAQRFRPESGHLVRGVGSARRPQGDIPEANSLWCKCRFCLVPWFQIKEIIFFSHRRWICPTACKALVHPSIGSRSSGPKSIMLRPSSSSKRWPSARETQRRRHSNNSEYDFDTTFSLIAGKKAREITVMFKSILFDVEPK